MRTLVIAVLAAGGIIGVYLWARSAWPEITARVWALAGNSRTIAIAYAAELLGMLDEAKILDWSQLVGAQNAGRVVVVMGVAMIVLRLVTRTAVSFKA